MIAAAHKVLSREELSRAKEWSKKCEQHYLDVKRALIEKMRTEKIRKE